MQFLYKRNIIVIDGISEIITRIYVNVKVYDFEDIKDS